MLSERRFKQDVSIRILPGDSGRSLVCEYNLFYPYPSMHLPPWALKNEVRQLERWMNEGSVMARDRHAGRETGRFSNFVLNFPLRILYRLYRMFSWLRYRAGRRLTPAGTLALVALMAAAMIGVDTETTVAYQAFTPLLCLLLFAAAFSWSFRPRFSAARRLPRFGTVGRAVTYNVALQNLGRRIESDLAVLENLDDPRPAFAEWKAVRLADAPRVRSFRVEPHRANPFRIARVKDAAVPPVRPGGEVEVNVELTPLRRGVIRFLGLTLARPDPFGLFRAFGRWRCRRRCWCCRGVTRCRRSRCRARCATRRAASHWRPTWARATSSWRCGITGAAIRCGTSTGAAGPRWASRS